MRRIILRRIFEAIAFFRKNSVLFNAIILTVWLPGEILLWLSVLIPTQAGFNPAMSSFNEQFISQIAIYIFVPIFRGAILHIFFADKRGQHVSYKEAMYSGLQNWGRFLAVEFRYASYMLCVVLMTTLTSSILAGATLYSWFHRVGIVVSLIWLAALWARYSLISSVVIDEGLGMRAFRRSVQLTKRRRWSIFWTQLRIWSICIVLLAFGTLLATKNQLVINVLNSYCFTLIVVLGDLTNATFYWEAKSVEPIVYLD